MKKGTRVLASVEKKALTGDVGAQFYLSVMYEDGRGVDRDLSKAADWCTKGARAGDRQCQYRLSKMIESGRGFEKRSERAAWYWLDKAAQAGHTQARFELGVRHLFGVAGVRKSLMRAKRCLAAAADAEHAEANYYLGFMYLHGLGFAEDPATAFQYFSLSAELNNPGAQCALGFMLQQGIGCKLDLAMSMGFYQQAAARGHAGAQFGLACLNLFLGEYSDAFVWLDIAANNGVVPAQAILAQLHTHGVGIGRDVVKALMWCLIVQNSELADEESLSIVNVCHHGLVSFAQQEELDEAYTLAWNWLYCRDQARSLPETDWSEQLKREIAIYEKHKKGWA